MKLLGIVLAGVFVGVVLREILRQTKPETLEAAEKKVGGVFSSIKSSFKEGYQQTA